MHTLPPNRIPAKSPRVLALKRWFQDMNMAVLGLTTAKHPQFPIIQGTTRRATPRSMPFRPMGGAA